MVTKQRKPKVKTDVSLDLSYLHAIPLFIGEFRAVNLYLIGCGGTGSWLAPSMVRIARVLCAERQVEVNVMFVDPDIVEAGNIFRQHFCDAEIGQPKAVALATRYGLAWGMEIQAITAHFDKALLSHGYGAYRDTLTVFIGCVDNAAARKSIAEALGQLNYSAEQRPSAWWLDCGNSRTSGQVLLGSATKPNQLVRAFDLRTVCTALPSPSLQHPELLMPKPEEHTDNGMSCEEMAAGNTQSLTVNQMVAAIAADYLTGLLLSQDLRCYATYFELASKSARSNYIALESVLATEDVTHIEPRRSKAKRRSR